MDVVSYIQGAAIAPPGAYAVESQPDQGQQNQPAANSAATAIPTDSFTPSSGSAGVAPELATALRHAPDAGSLDTCYCGHCPRCQARQAEKETETPLTERQPVERDAVQQEQESRKTDSSDDEKVDEKQELSDEEQRQVDELRQRDQEVRAHEQAHAAAGGRNVRYDYQSGPDGRQYAVGGSADIEITAMSNDHNGKISEARKMRAAALAPSDPSTQDMAVAARATRIEMEAVAEKADEQRESLRADGDGAQSGYGADSPATVSSDRELFFAMG